MVLGRVLHSKVYGRVTLLLSLQNKFATASPTLTDTVGWRVTVVVTKWLMEHTETEA